MKSGMRNLVPNLVLVAALLAPAGVHAQERLHGRVLDAVTGEALVMATVLVPGRDTGSATDNYGHFSLLLPPGSHTLRVSSVGYATRLVPVTVGSGHEEELVVRLQPAVIPIDAVVVTGAALRVSDPAASSHHMHATEDLLDRVPGADFIQRANFAWEPVVRGLSGGQVGLVIDGMKVVGACVDKMDPTSAYVEVENLERLELSKGGFDLTQASQIGGTVNLVTRSPGFDRSFYAKAELGVASAAAERRGHVTGGVARGKTSIRGSFSYKTASDFHPGSAASVPNSGYQKNNYKFDAARRLGERHEVMASFLADNAWDVGYPVLLMDATLAAARIYSVSHTWTPRSPRLEQWESRVYHNTVDHWMDDFGRDVMQRRVMRGMNMPMYGATRTSGGISTLDMALGPRTLGITLDAYETKSYGDMWMFSVFEHVPNMYLLNLGDVRVRHGALSADFSTPLHSRMSARFNARLDISPRDVLRDEAAAILRGRWGVDDVSSTYVLGGASGTLVYAAGASTRLRLALAYVGRLPTHVENYGHYVYNYADGYFYSGNPDLKPERSSQAELGLERWTRRSGLKANLFVNHVSHYIVGLDNEGLAGGSGTLRFRTYENARAAVLVGGELSGTMALAEGLEVAGTAAYTRGQNLEVHEPLYLIPPLTGLLSIRLDRKRWWSELESRMAMPQNRVAHIVAGENGTDGYFVLNARGSIRLAPEINLRLGVENVFDTFYHEHLSIGDLPSLGRNLYAAAALSL